MAVYLQASTVNCALGNSTEAIQQQLDNGVPALEKVSLGLTEDDVEVPYHRIPSYPLHQPNRLYDLLEETLAPFFASLNLDPTTQSKTALFFGSTSYDVGHRAETIQQNPSQQTAQLTPLSTIPNWISQRFQLSGLQYAYNSACSSSMNALVHAKAMLDANIIEHAIVVGCELYNPLALNGFHSLQLLAQERCQPFKPQDGMVLGEAIAAGYLTKQAVANSLELKAGLTQTDTANITCTQGDGSAIANLISELIGAETQTIDAIKCHGVGTNNADQAELNGLESVFGKPLPLIGFKPFIGNTLGAAGMAELALLQQLFQLDTLPSSSFQTDATAKSLKGKSILVNNFGFGGNNSCLWVKHHAE